MSTALKSPTWPFSLKMYFGIRTACFSTNREAWDVSYASRLKEQRREQFNYDGGMMGGMQMFSRLIDKGYFA